MSKNSKANECILNPATSKGGSLRATVPVFIIDQFELKKGDILKWKIKEDHLEVEILKMVNKNG